MPIRERVKDKASAFKGQKSGLPIESYGIDSAEQITNFHVRNGQLEKVNGNVIYATLTGAGAVNSLHRFKYLWLGQQQSSLFIETPSSLPIGSVDGNGIFFQLNAASPLISAATLYSSVWRNQIFLTNGQDCQSILSIEGGSSGGGFSYQKLGLDSPDKVALTITNSNSGNVDAGDHYYMISLYDGNTNTESPCAGAFPSIYGLTELSPNGFLGPIPTRLADAGSGKTVLIKYANLVTYLEAELAKYPRATHFIIYRSTATVSGLYPSFFQVPMVNGSSSQNGNVHINIFSFINDIQDFIDNTADASLPAVSPPTNNSPPPTPARLLAGFTYAKNTYSPSLGILENWTAQDYSGFLHTRVFRDQLFGVGAFSYGFTVTAEVALAAGQEKVSGKVLNFRDVIHGSEVFQPDYFPYVWEVGVGDGQTTTGLGILMDFALLAFKDKSTYYLGGASPDNYVLRIMDSMRGAVHCSTIQETPVGVITLDRGGFVLWNQIGHGVPISNDIQDIIDQITFTNAANFYSCYNFLFRRYECSVTTPGFQYPNLTLEYNIDSGQWSTAQGQEGYSRKIDSKVNGALIELVGSTTNGRLLDYSSSINVTNQGGGITAIWKSGSINFGDDQHKKRVKWLYIRAKSGKNWKVNIDIIPDYDESRTWTYPGGYDSLASLSTWYSSIAATDGTLIWDDGSGSVGGNWESANLTRQIAKIPVEGVGYNFQVRITNFDLDPNNYGFAIESVSLEGVQLGR